MPCTILYIPLTPQGTMSNLQNKATVNSDMYYIPSSNNVLLNIIYTNLLCRASAPGLRCFAFLVRLVFGKEGTDLRTVDSYLRFTVIVLQNIVE